MKLLSKTYTKNGEGSVKLVAEEGESPLAPPGLYLHKSRLLKQDGCMLWDEPLPPVAKCMWTAFEESVVN